MKVDYIDHMGDDLRVVNAARVSFDKHHDEFEEGKDDKLIGYLGCNDHWTPFGHPQVTLRETVPIFVARERFRHTIGFVYNEVSRRYVTADPEFFKLDVWRKKADNVKQGSGDNFDLVDNNRLNDSVRYWNKSCLAMYQYMLKQEGVAPEQARMVLPQSIYTSYYVTGSLAAWARFYKQRTHPHAQQEIQDLAKMVGAHIEPLFPVAWKELTK